MNMGSTLIWTHLDSQVAVVFQSLLLVFGLKCMEKKTKKNKHKQTKKQNDRNWRSRHIDSVV